MLDLGEAAVEAAEGEVPERAEDDFRFGGWRILGVWGGARGGTISHV